MLPANNYCVENSYIPQNELRRMSENQGMQQNSFTELNINKNAQKHINGFARLSHKNQGGLAYDNR